MGRSEYLSLFENTRARGRLINRLFVISLFVATCFIWVYRLSYIPKNGEGGKWAWLGLLGAELWFCLNWLFHQAVCWNPVYRKNFKNRLSQRLKLYLYFICSLRFQAL
uniref:Uncharacterized protein n=1 Tax=Lotus japonicus TaxID=34305 RepID=I3SGD8_LOTJA|nr:unknown [Lotus japonicus]